MSKAISVNENVFRDVIRSRLPLLDLRAPIEFTKGSFSHSVNLPLMFDEERAAVGLCYKQLGQNAAIALGNQLVSGEVLSSRMSAWKTFVANNPTGYLYCFRGGLRSQTVQRWLADEGVDYPLLMGGYKAMRQFLLAELERLAAHPFCLIGGRTGSGKTTFLQQCPTSLDLEAAANHRGSSFGGFVQAQATQINFENNLAEQYVCGNFSPTQSLVLEDEGQLIGRVYLPQSLLASMQCAPVVVIEEAFDLRITQIHQEYILEMYNQFIVAQGEELGFKNFGQYLAQGLFKVRKRLGLQRYQQLNLLLDQALSRQLSGDMQHHFDWLVPLVREYYDPMYDYQLSLKRNRIVFSGSKMQCLQYVTQ